LKPKLTYDYIQKCIFVHRCNSIHRFDRRLEKIVSDPIFIHCFWISFFNNHCWSRRFACLWNAQKWRCFSSTDKFTECSVPNQYVKNRVLLYCGFLYIKCAAYFTQLFQLSLQHTYSEVLLSHLHIHTQHREQIWKIMSSFSFSLPLLIFYWLVLNCGT